jgi:CAAX protease family protein
MGMPSKTRDSVALAFAMLFPLAMAWLYFVVLADQDARANEALQLAIGVGKMVQFTFPLVYVWWFEPDRLVLRKPTTAGLVLGVGFGLLIAAAIIGLYLYWLRSSPLLGEAPARIYRKVQEFNLATPSAYLTLSLGICSIHSLFEEYYWRWFVFGTLRPHMPVMGAIVLSSAGFVLHHIVILGVYFSDQFWMLAVPFSLCVGVGGGVWAWIYHRARSLYAAWVSHALIDAAILYVGYLMIAPYFEH